MNTDLLDAFVQRLRGTRSDPCDVPGFDPQNGNLNAKLLLVLEAPGQGAVASKRVSIDNDDPTAKNLKALLAKAGIRKDDLIVWNVVPWYCGSPDKKKIEVPSVKSLTEGIESLCTLVPLLKNLEAIVLVGSTARKAHVRLSAITQARILSCHHMSQRVLNVNKNAARENEEVFQFLGGNLA